MSAVDNWNADDWFPNLDLGQKVIVAYTGSPASDLLMKIAIQRYGVSRTVLMYVAINPLSFNRDQYDADYSRVMESSTAYDCQKVFIDKRHMPDPKEVRKELDYKSIIVDTMESFKIPMATSHIFLGSGQEVFIERDVRLQLAQMGIHVELFVEMFPEHAINNYPHLIENLQEHAKLISYWDQDAFEEALMLSTDLNIISPFTNMNDEDISALQSKLKF